MQSMSARLRWTREQFDYTQADLAKQAGVALSTIRRIEQDKFNLRLSTIERIAETLHIRGAWLVYGEEPIVSPSDMAVEEQRRSNASCSVVNSNDGSWYRKNGMWMKRKSKEGD